MRRLPGRVRRWIDPRKKSGAVPLSPDQVEWLVHKASRSNLETLCRQGAEVLPKEVFADKDLMSAVRDRCGAEVLPVSLNTLRDDSAARDWLEGRLELPSKKRALAANSVRDTKATRALQRALMKIGVYHPHLDDKQRAALLQLPWGANGELGRPTMRALWVALEISGRSYMQEKLDFDLPLDFTIAQAVEEMLADKVLAVNPNTEVPYIALPQVKPMDRAEEDAPDTCLYIGLHRFGEEEAAELERIFEGSGVRIDPLVNWELVAGNIEYKGRFFSLRDEVELDNFLSEAFQPALTEEQRKGVEEIFKGWNIREDSLDEMAEIVVAFHEAEYGERDLKMLILSGHHSVAQGTLYADAGGVFPDRMLGHLARLFPRAAEQVEFVMMGASNRLFDYHIVHDLEQLPEFRPGGKGVAVGYRGKAPGTWMGGLNHALAAAKAFLASRAAYQKRDREKDLIVKWSHFSRELWGLDLKSPDGRLYSGEFLDNLAIYNAQDERYRLAGDGDSRKLERAAAPAPHMLPGRPMTPDEGRLQTVQPGRIRNQADFHSVLLGTFPGMDLRDVEPDNADLVSFREQLSDPLERRKVDLALNWSRLSNHWLDENQEAFDDAVTDLVWAHEEVCLKGTTPFFIARTVEAMKQAKLREWLDWEKKALEVVRLASTLDPPAPIDEDTVATLADLRKICLELEVEDVWLAQTGFQLENESPAEPVPA